MALVHESSGSAVVWLSLAVAAVALVSLGIVLALLARLRTRVSTGTPTVATPDELAQALREAEKRVAELAASEDRWREEARWVRRFADIGSTLDLDEVLSRILAAAADVPGVDAAMLVVDPTADGEPLVATFGMAADEAGALRAPAVPEVGGARAVTVSYRYAEERQEADGGLLRGGVVIPIVVGEESVGSLAAFWRGVERELSDRELALLEELAARSGPAILNAQRFADVRQLASLDALTGLHNRRFFHETLEHEVARAQRYERPLALTILDIDGFKEVNDRLGHLAGDAILADLAAAMRSAVRGADIACRVGGDEFAIVLPESTVSDAERLYQRLKHAVASRPTPADRLDLSAGVAEVAPSDTSESFFRRADDALYQAKHAGKGELRSAGIPPAATG